MLSPHREYEFFTYTLLPSLQQALSGVDTSSTDVVSDHAPLELYAQIRRISDSGGCSQQQRYYSCKHTKVKTAVET